MKNPVIIYTDGACRGNPGPGGWGAVLTYGDHRKELYGGESRTTNNRMELTAAIESLKALTRPSRVSVYTDSKYVKNGIQKWMQNWKKKNWRTAQGGAVKNQDLWKVLDELVGRHEVDWHWVKGHSGDPGNERADRLAKRGIGRR